MNLCIDTELTPLVNLVISNPMLRTWEGKPTYLYFYKFDGVEEHPHVIEDRDFGQCVLLGKKFTYYDYNPPTVGLARVRMDKYSSGKNIYSFVPFEWDEDTNASLEGWSQRYGKWAYLIYPTVYAESSADFCVINAWDLAYMTLGVGQLAAHSYDDLLPMIKGLITELADEAQNWFPELQIAESGELQGKIKGTEEFVSLETKRVGSNWILDDFPKFFNPNAYNIEDEELHVAIRWYEWTRQSYSMRKVQVAQTFANGIRSVRSIATHLNVLGADIEQVSGDDLALAIGVVHWSTSRASQVAQFLVDGNIKEVMSSYEDNVDRGRNLITGLNKVNNLIGLENLRYSTASQRPILE